MLEAGTGARGSTAIHARRVLVASERGDATIGPVDIDVEPGRLLAITGPSGAGKTTLLDVLRGEMAPHAGAVHLGGHAVDTFSPAARRAAVLWSPQQPDLVGDDMWSAVRLGIERLDASGAATTNALDRFGVLDLADRDPASLSGGERRRAALASVALRVAVTGSAVALLDEPTAHLDDAATAGVVRWLRDVCRRDRGRSCHSRPTHRRGERRRHRGRGGVRRVRCRRSAQCRDGPDARLVPEGARPTSRGATRRGGPGVGPAARGQPRASGPRARDRASRARVPAARPRDAPAARARRPCRGLLGRPAPYGGVAHRACVAAPVVRCARCGRGGRPGLRSRQGSAAVRRAPGRSRCCPAQGERGACARGATPRGAFTSSRTRARPRRSPGPVSSAMSTDSTTSPNGS